VKLHPMIPARKTESPEGCVLIDRRHRAILPASPPSVKDLDRRCLQIGPPGRTAIRRAPAGMCVRLSLKPFAFDGN
jgi:hypothetical protein